MSDTITDGFTSKPTPDPTVLTSEASDRAKNSADLVDALRDTGLQRELKLRSDHRRSEVKNLKADLEAHTISMETLINALREGDTKLATTKYDLIFEKVNSIRREIIIYETHRLELKGDSEKTLSTATIAAEKAVQAALAAAEKARDQQTIASQLATTKAEDASKEQLKQQSETFTTQIASLTTGLGDVKSLLGELRAERRGGNDQRTETRDAGASRGLWVGVAVAAFVGINGLLFTAIGVAVTIFLTK